MRRFANLPFIMAALRGIVRKIGCRRFVFVSFALFTLILVLLNSCKLNIRDMLELNKCPACYGVSLCNDVLQGSSQISIEFDFWGRFGLLVNTFATKNVYSGWLGHQRIIIKRLGQNFELRQMDHIICKAMGTEENCGDKMKEVVFKIPNMRESVKKLLEDLSDSNNFRLQLCPSTEHVETLFSPILPQSNNSNSSKLSNDGFTANIWTLLLINPEPLLLQILRAEDGWPVPQYLGACGRIAVMLNAGEPLTNYFSKPWPERAGLALQLLLAADRFTYSHPRFAFYLLDISSDNIVVSDVGKVSFVDLEHVIVVDRHPPYVPDTWNESHFSESWNDCPSCSVFSAHSICNHHTSDHNHFMICQHLLAPGMESSVGLLHSVPSHIQEHYPQIETYLHGCSAGSVTDRIRSARRLRDIINIASRESPLFSDPTLMNTWKYF